MCVFSTFVKKISLLNNKGYIKTKYMFYHESKGERDYCWRFTNNTNNNNHFYNIY